jgi:cytochrome bd-type quinol oxidase subunit 2
VPNPLSRTLRAYAADARAAFSAAPVEVALGVFLAVMLSIQVRNEGFTEDDFARIAASVALAFPLVFGLSVLRARGVVSAAARWAGTLGILIASAAFGYLALDTDREAEGWRWFLLAAAAVLLLTMTPSLPWRTRDRRASWAFAWRLAVRVVGIGLYSAALYAVLAGAVAAVISLFDLGRPEHLYTDLAGAVFFAFAPWILVGGIHRLFAPAEPGVPLAVSRLGRWLYTPVLVIYLLILYAYAAKVLATGELPRNLVSPLVIAAGLIGLLGAVLLEPAHDDDEHRGVSLLARAVPALLLPLVPLAAWALTARLGEYGWTEFRYVRLAAVAAIGILAVLGTIRLVRRRPPLLTTVPAVFAAVLLLSAVGPWSAPAVSRRDQTARLRAAFREARVDPKNLPRDTVTVDSALFERISSGARYLVDAHGIGALQAVVPSLPDSTRATYAMAAALRIRGGCSAGRLVSADLAWQGGVPVIGGAAHEVHLVEGDSLAVSIGAVGLRVWLDGDRLVAAAPAWRAAADLSAARRALEPRSVECDAEWRGTPTPLPPAQAVLAVRDSAGALMGQLLVTQLSVGGPQPGKGPSPPGIRVRGVRGLLVLPQPRP